MKSLLVVLCVLSVTMTANAQSPYPTCGNGTLEPGEFCDDGNTLDGDLCAASCLFGAPPSVAPLPATPTRYRETPPPYPSLMLSPGRALGLSLASTLLTGGAIPSLGHMYAGEYRRAVASWGLRMTGGVVAVFGAFVLVVTAFDDGLTPDGTPCNPAGFGCGAGAVYMGLGAVVGTMIFDVADAPAAALRSSQRGKRPWQLGVAPSAMPALGGGMSLQLKF